MQKADQLTHFIKHKATEAYTRHQRFVPAAAFVAGMVVDILTVGRPDELLNIIQQALYLLVVAFLLALETIDETAPLALSPRLAKAWKHRDEVLHFLLGSMLSAYTIFYFKSSSLWGSVAFFLIIISLLVGNEFTALRRVGLPMRFALFAVCTTSYLFCVVPLVFKRVGAIPFVTSVGLSLLVGIAMCWALYRRVGDQQRVRRRALFPYTAVIAAFLLLYVFRVIPPVPLSATHLGIYRSVDRVDGGYRVSYEKPKWRFWETGDQRFRARPGDKIYCFFSVFSPGGFNDSVRVRWLFRDPKVGWRKLDAVPVAISGGRDHGYRGFAYKANFQEGNWQVRIETSDELEIGRIYLTVTSTDLETPLRLKEELL